MAMASPRCTGAPCWTPSSAIGSCRSRLWGGKGRAQWQALRVDGEVLPFCEQGCKAVVDSGTSLLAVPTPIFPELYELLRWRNSLGLAGKLGLRPPWRENVQRPGLVAVPSAKASPRRSPKLQIELEGFTVELDGEALRTSQVPRGVPCEDFSRLDQKPTERPHEWGRAHTPAEETTRRDMTCKPMLMVMDLRGSLRSQAIDGEMLRPEPIGPKLFILGEPVLKTGL